jgi:hypothetical protein
MNYRYKVAHNAPFAGLLLIVLMPLKIEDQRY